MPGSHTPRRALVGFLLVLLLAVLAAPPAHARPFHAVYADSLLSWLWETLGRLTSGFTKEGSMMDPGGQPEAAPAPGNTTDEGGMMDPYG